MQHLLRSPFVLLLAVSACAQAQDGTPLLSPRPPAPDGEQPYRPEPELTSPQVGPIARDVEELPVAEEPPLVIPSEPSAPSPLPVACPGGPDPSIVTLDPDQRVADIALGPSHVYWSSAESIHRRAKAGGSAEIVTSIEHATGPLLVAGDMLYWSGSGTEIFAMPSDGSAQPVRLVDDLANSLAWTATASRVYYMAQSLGDANGGGVDCTGNQLKSVPSSGGEPEVLAEHQGTYGPLAADATGIYWSEALRCVPPDGKIAKYTFETAAVSTFAHATGIAHSLRAAGGRVLWVDESGIWSSPPEAAEPVLLAHPPLVRGLATDGTAAYFAASDPDGEYSYRPQADVFSIPLAGGEPRKVACQIYGIDEFWFVADSRAVYYRSWIHDLIGSLPTSDGAATEP